MEDLNTFHISNISITLRIPHSTSSDGTDQGCFRKILQNHYFKSYSIVKFQVRLYIEHLIYPRQWNESLLNLKYQNILWWFLYHLHFQLTWLPQLNPLNRISKTVIFNNISPQNASWNQVYIGFFVNYSNGRYSTKNFGMQLFGSTSNEDMPTITNWKII